MAFRLIGIFAFPLEQFFLTRDFPIFSSSSSFFFFFIFFFFFFSHRPSALRKRGKGPIFTPNISTGDGGVHRHQAIVPFLLYGTTTKSRDLQLHITERRHFTTATPFRVRAIYVDVYSADGTCCCQSPFLSLQLLAALTASLVSYGVVTLSHNEFHCRTSFLSGAAACCSHYFMSWISHFLNYW